MAARYPLFPHTQTHTLPWVLAGFLKFYPKQKLKENVASVGKNER